MRKICVQFFFFVPGKGKNGAHKGKKWVEVEALCLFRKSDSDDARDFASWGNPEVAHSFAKERKGGIKDEESKMINQVSTREVQSKRLRLSMLTFFF